MHDANETLDHRIEHGSLAVGAVGAETGDRAVDDIGIAGGDGVEVNAQPFHHPRPEVLHNDVAALRQAEHDLDPVGGRKIDGETAFTPIAVCVQPPDVVGPGHAGEFTADRFDLDHLGTLLGQDLGGQRAGHHLAEIEHPDSFEWSPHTGDDRRRRLRLPPDRLRPLLAISTDGFRDRFWPMVEEMWERTPGGAVLMDGNRLRDELVVDLKGRVEALGNPYVCLATVLVGDDKPSQIYVRNKRKKAEEAGMVSRHVELPGDISQPDLEAAVRDLADDPAVHGILVQLPLPDGLDAERILDLLPPEKDVDGLTERSMGRLLRGRDGHVPCTPLGVMRLMERFGVETAGKKAVVIGRSTLVGLPQVLLLGRKGCDATPTLAHSRSGDLAAICREADIIVAAVGVAGLVTAEFVKPGAAVLDVGISRTADGIQGDVDFDAVQAVAGAITPMPGGTGPMTIGCLMENTFNAARMQGAFA